MFSDLAAVPNSYLDIIREAGGRITPVVTSLIGYLYTSSKVHSPQHLRVKLNTIHLSNIGFPTIYRALDRLIRCRLVYRMHRDDGQTMYFICQNPQCTHHHHFICTTCQRVFEIDMCLVKEYESHVARFLEASITKHIIQFEGLCKKCRINPNQSVEINDLV